MFKIILILILLSEFVTAQRPRFHKEVERGDEEELRVRITAGLGNLYISKGKPDRIAIIDAYPKSKFIWGAYTYKIDIDYEVEDEIGYLDIEWKSALSGDLYIKLCDEIPISIEIELGVSRADMDMSGLRIKNMKLSAGVSSTTVRFNEPNREIMRRFEIEAGVSKFRGERLGNANFRKLIVKGGIGAMYLDMSGEFLDRSEIELSAGFGNINIYMPDDIGIKLISENPFSLKSFEKFYINDDGEYISFNYDRARKKVTMRIETGFSNIKVRWID